MEPNNNSNSSTSDAVLARLEYGMLQIVSRNSVTCTHLWDFTYRYSDKVHIQGTHTWYEWLADNTFTYTAMHSAAPTPILGVFLSPTLVKNLLLSNNNEDTGVTSSDIICTVSQAVLMDWTG